MRVPFRLTSPLADIDMGVDAFKMLEFTVPDSFGRHAALSRLTIEILDINTATTCTAYLTRKVDGKTPVAPAVPSAHTIVLQAGASDGAVVFDLGNSAYAPNVGAGEGFYALVMLDGGTATLRGFLEGFQG